MDPSELIKRQTEAWGTSVTPEALEQLEAYAGLLSSYRRANVIGTRDPRTVLLDHVLDSLSSFLFIPLREARRLVDVGSGGGLPGLPIKLARSEFELALVESTGKKADFLRLVVAALSLSHVEVVNKRAEEIGHTPEHRGAYDAATTRAVARLSVVAEYCVPLLRLGGHAICMKGRIEPDEFSEGNRAARHLGASVLDVIPVPLLPEVTDKERNLVVLEKVRKTPTKYPRRTGTARKKPLGSRMP
jgi:16S rRNA (guanine527-N7)-methyltransferase